MVIMDQARGKVRVAVQDLVLSVGCLLVVVQVQDLALLVECLLEAVQKVEEQGNQKRNLYGKELTKKVGIMERLFMRIIPHMELPQEQEKFGMILFKSIPRRLCIFVLFTQ